MLSGLRAKVWECFSLSGDTGLTIAECALATGHPTTAVNSSVQWLIKYKLITRTEDRRNDRTIYKGVRDAEGVTGIGGTSDESVQRESSRLLPMGEGLASGTRARVSKVRDVDANQNVGPSARLSEQAMQDYGNAFMGAYAVGRASSGLRDMAQDHTEEVGSGYLSARQIRSRSGR